MRVARLPILWFTAALFVGGAGCELVAQVDRSEVPEGPGSGGSGGSGGAMSTSTATSTSTGTGGSGGSGGATSSTGPGGSGGGTSTSTSTSTGTGGAGGMPCTTAANCPQTGSECITATCTAGMCGTTDVAVGTATTMQTAGDCRANECDGNGAILSVNDDDDIKDDSNPCTVDTCAAGVPTHTPGMVGLGCGTNQVCNAAGNCVGCVTATSCAGQDDECKTRTCIANVCGFSFTAAGTAVAAQTSADCKKNQCDGAGAIANVADNVDLPVDNQSCTSDVCTAGVPSNPPLAAGTACTQSGGTSCNGAGQCVQCVMASTCPGADTACQTRTCTGGVCGFTFAASGTATTTQTAGDCQQNQCNGAGAIVSANQNTDVPVDGNLCTSDVCTAGTPSNPPVAAGSMCGAGLVCNATGTCLGCNTGLDCPGMDTECQTRACTGGVCGFTFAASGTATTTQTAGDCQQNQCNGAGAIVSANQNTDVPVDALECTTDTCTAGVPTFTPVASGATCNQNGGTRCNAVGVCVQCTTASDCSGSDTDCQIRTCTAGACGLFNTAAGNPTSMQTAGNCQVNQCDGNGSAVNAADNADVPVDSQQCTSDICTAGMPSNPPLAAGTACTQSGGTSCNAAGVCIAAGVNHLVINEVDYDQVNADSAEFVEIYNGTGAAVALSDYSLVLVNGNNNTTYLTLSLASAGTLPAGGYLVVGSSAVMVPATALKINFALAADNIQNGAPDGVALVNTTTGSLVDALSYEGAMTSAAVTGITGMVSLVEGTVLPATTADSNTLAGSLSRLPNGTDLNNAATDWAFTATSTPGAANL